MKKNKETLKKEPAQVINIGEIESTTYGYQPDDDSLFIQAVAETYTKRKPNEDDPSKI